MFDKDSFKHMKEYFSLGVASTLMCCLEFWCYEIMTLMSGLFSVNDVASNVIALNIAYQAYCMTIGF